MASAKAENESRERKETRDKTNEISFFSFSYHLQRQEARGVRASYLLNCVYLFQISLPSYTAVWALAASITA